MKIGKFVVKPRAFIILAIILIILVLILVKCAGDKGTSKGNPEQGTPISEAELFNTNISASLGSNLNGKQIKELIDKIKGINESLPADTKINISLVAFKGTIVTNYTSVFEDDISKGVGNEFSRYSATEDGFDDNGYINAIRINQIVGNSADPEITETVSYDDMYIDE